jgi:hypothetical protein
MIICSRMHETWAQDGCCLDNFETFEVEHLSGLAYLSPIPPFSLGVTRSRSSPHIGVIALATSPSVAQGFVHIMGREKQMDRLAA